MDKAIKDTRTDEQIINRALELVRDGLRSGGIPDENFNMDYWSDVRTGANGAHCGSVCCIGGWVQALLRSAGYVSAACEINKPSRYSLFYPYGIPGSWTFIRPAQAADAIDRFLAGKKPW